MMTDTPAPSLAQRAVAAFRACAHDIALHLKLHWAGLRGDHIKALQLTKEISMANLAALSAAVAWAISQHQADQKSIAQAQAALASQQADVDELTAQLVAEFGSPPAPAAAEPAPQAAAPAPAVVPTVAIDPATAAPIVDASGTPVVATHVPDATGAPVPASTMTDPVTGAPATPTLVIDPASGAAVAANATVDASGNVVPVAPVAADPVIQPPVLDLNPNAQ